MNAHKNARTTPYSRVVMVRRVLEEGWSAKDAASALAVSERTVHKWLARYRAAGVDDRHVSTVLPPAFLAPDIVEAVVKGMQPADLAATRLIRRLDLALDWETQRRQLGFK